jgi:hypothetical protein
MHLWRGLAFIARELIGRRISPAMNRPKSQRRFARSETVQVTSYWGASDEDAWRSAGRRQFEAAYTEDDSVYESLIHDAPAAK